MIILLSPSKTLDFTKQPRTAPHSQPQFLADSETLIRLLRKYKPAKLSELMGISDKLAKLNADRYRDFTMPFTPDNARQALLAFKGDVYQGMEVTRYSKQDFAFAQRHLRILSGLYGLLRPLDLIQPYRLEMGIPLKNPMGKDLYAFWGERITQAINASLAEHKNKVVVNLASEEYFKAVQPHRLNGRLLTIQFKERQKDGSLKTIGLFAKKVRGLMADAIIRGRIDEVEDVKQFIQRGYEFAAPLSTGDTYVFIR